MSKENLKSPIFINGFKDLPNASKLAFFAIISPRHMTEAMLDAEIADDIANGRLKETSMRAKLQAKEAKRNAENFSTFTDTDRFLEIIFNAEGVDMEGKDRMEMVLDPTQALTLFTSPKPSMRSLILMTLWPKSLQRRARDHPVQCQKRILSMLRSHQKMELRCCVCVSKRRKPSVCSCCWHVKVGELGVERTRQILLWWSMRFSPPTPRLSLAALC